MCDCSHDDKDENVSDVTSVKTTMFFEKCSKLPIQRPDYAVETLLDGARLNRHALKMRQPCSTEPSMVRKCSGNISSMKPPSQESLPESKKMKLKCDTFGECEGLEMECTRNDKNYDEESYLMYTLAIIKPEVIVNRDEIERLFEEDFGLNQSKCVQMTSEQVSECYADCYGTVEFAHFVAYMASGPIIVKVLMNRKIPEKRRLLMRPTKVTESKLCFPGNVRAQNGTRYQSYRNSVRGSETHEQTEEEIHFFFPEFGLEPLLEGQKAENYLRETINRVLARGLVVCCKVKPMEPVLWLANWLLMNNPKLPMSDCAVMSREKEG